MIRKSKFVIVVAFSVSLLSGPTIGDGQEVRLARMVAAIKAVGSQEDTNVDAESGAILKTSPDLEGVLETAERIRKDGNYRVATQLWQEVLKQSGDALFSADGSTYFSLGQQIEEILAGLPPEGLTAYRVTADAAAKEILAEAGDPNDVTALNKIVRQYFISSMGDEAAYSLGCIYLDRFDFIGARRMFEKVANGYPDPTVPMEEVHARIALCQSYLGDVKSAKVSLAKADEVRANSGRAELVRDTLGNLVAGEGNVLSSSNWKMPLGDVRRYGTTLSVPEEFMQADLAAVWQYYFEPRSKFNKGADVDGMMLSGEQASGKTVLDTRVTIEKDIIEKWREKTWRPSGNLLIDGDRVYFKTGGDLAVWSREKVNKISKVSSEQSKLDAAILWRSVWRNAFQIDQATLMGSRMRVMYSGQGGSQASNGPDPTSTAEVQLFGDTIYQQMSIHNGNVFTIEGKSFDDANKHLAPKVTSQWNATYRRTRTNFLTAYDSVTGEVQWRLPREPEKSEDETSVLTEVEDSPWLTSGGFMASPIGFGDMVLVPVNNGGAISIYALDPSNGGKTIWKSFLCDEPEHGAVAWSPINLSMDGSDLFVNCGMGVVFVLDPATGTVRFAKRYARAGVENNLGRRSGMQMVRMDFDGWSSDIVIPYGRQMICFSSDSETIEAYDRNNGKMIWRSEMSPIGFKVDYLLGVYNDMLYAAGPETIVAYDLKGEGRMIWGADQLFDGKLSFGKGMLTPSGIYMPVEDNIYQFDLIGNKGKANIISKVHVDLGTNAPVGNLFSDGERIWVHGANRLYALGKAPEE
ncbi:MAG: PQQ-binding-like beta-propeller repeat protein [Mariniblastus sp.]